MNDWDRCKGCRKRFKEGEGRGYLRKSRMIWAHDEACYEAWKRRKKRLRAKRRRGLVAV